MKTKTLLVSLVVLLFAGAVVAAVFFLYPYQPDQPPSADDIDATPAGVEEVVGANNQFALELYSQLGKAERGNIFYSPYSIFAALAMTYEGAKGQTAAEMQSVFHFPGSNVLRPNFAKIYNDINEKAEDYELRTGNALWVQQDYPFLEDYMSRVEQYYGGKAAETDFVHEAEKARQTINSFIEEQTNNKIKDLIPAGALNEMTRLVLTNAIYFKGTWRWQFDEADTFEGEFKISPSNTVKTQMMYMEPDEASFNYADTEDLQVLELPYKGEDVSMLILLPKDNLESVESSLTAEKLSQYKQQMRETKLDEIYLPKFEFDTKYFLGGTLAALGMPTAFSESADFSGMTGKKDLFISAVIHQAYIKVDEEGTEAAAATAVIMELTAALPTNVFRADHPFIFIIQEQESGNILFMGRVVDPSQ